MGKKLTPKIGRSSLSGLRNIIAFESPNPQSKTTLVPGEGNGTDKTKFEIYLSIGTMDCPPIATRYNNFKAFLNP